MLLIRLSLALLVLLPLGLSAAGLILVAREGQWLIASVFGLLSAVLACLLYRALAYPLLSGQGPAVTGLMLAITYAVIVVGVLVVTGIARSWVGVACGVLALARLLVSIVALVACRQWLPPPDPQERAAATSSLCAIERHYSETFARIALPTVAAVPLVVLGYLLVARPFLSVGDVLGFLALLLSMPVGRIIDYARIRRMQAMVV